MDLSSALRMKDSHSQHPRKLLSLADVTNSSPTVLGSVKTKPQRPTDPTCGDWAEASQDLSPGGAGDHGMPVP